MPFERGAAGFRVSDIVRLEWCGSLEAEQTRGRGFEMLGANISLISDKLLSEIRSDSRGGVCATTASTLPLNMNPQLLQKSPRAFSSTFTMSFHVEQLKSYLWLR